MTMCFREFVPSREGQCVRRRASRTLTEVELRTVESFELSSRYNEVVKLCYNDPNAWDDCVQIALRPLPLNEHFVRRSARRAGHKRKVEPPKWPYHW